LERSSHKLALEREYPSELLFLIEKGET